MKKAWKWILGILVLLVVVFAVSFVVFNVMGSGPRAAVMPFDERAAPMMRDFDNFRHPMVGPGFDNFRRPMMGGRGFVPFGGLFFIGGLLRLLFPLGILALVAYFAYQMGKKAGAAALAPATPPAVSTPEGEPPQEN